MTYDLGVATGFQANQQIVVQYVRSDSDYAFGDGYVGGGLNFPVVNLAYCYNYFCNPFSWTVEPTTAEDYAPAFAFGPIARWPVDTGADIGSAVQQGYAEWDTTTTTATTKKHHTGVDIAWVGALGQPVKSILPGTVARIQKLDRNDHGDGNMVIVQHCPVSCAQPIYSQYAHLNKIDDTLLQAVLAACGIRDKHGNPQPDANGLIDCSGKRDASNKYPVDVSIAPKIGTVGGSGKNSLTYWPTHLHFEIRRSGDAMPGQWGVVGPLSAIPSPFQLDSTVGSACLPTKVAREQVPEYGYTCRHPDLSGYADPIAFMNYASDSLVMIRDLALTAVVLNREKVPIHWGPSTAYSSVMSTGAVGDQFYAIRTAGKTTGCTEGWIQVIRAGLDLPAMRTGFDVKGQYFPRSGNSGCTPAGWICKGDVPGSGWVSVIAPPANEQTILGQCTH